MHPTASIPGRADQAATPDLSAGATASLPGSPAPSLGVAPPVGDGPPGYELGELIGEGGMGVVHRARDVGFGRDVAVKLLRAGFRPDSPAVRRFVKEALVTGQLQHPGIPAAFATGTTPAGLPYLVMKLIRGDTLGDLLERKAKVNALAVFEAVCQAVGYAHAHGVIHRDLKPANVMVGAFGEVQVMDWGLAKVLGSPDGGAGDDADETTPATAIGTPDDGDSDSATRAGSYLGTPAYMPPEQAAGASREADRRSDVFGLGALLCAMLTGRPPFEGKTAESTRVAAARGHMAAALARLDACGADPDVVALCKRCLSIDPAGRPADAGAVAAEVAGLRSAADERARRAEIDAARRRVFVRAAAAVVTVLALGAAGVTAGLLDAIRARGEAEGATLQEQAARVKAEQAEASESLQRNAADLARRRADESAAAARASATQAQGVAGFMVDLFASPDPLDLFGKNYVPANYRQRSGRTARQLLDEAVGQLRAKLADQPLVRAGLLTTIGTSYVNLGEFAAARPLLGEAKDIRRRLLPPGHPDALATEKALGLLALESGDLAAAEEAFRLLVAAADGAGDAQSLSQARGFLGWALAMQGRPEAEALLRDEIAVRTRLHGASHRETLFMRVGLASVVLEAGRASDALPLVKDILKDIEAQPEGQVRNLGGAIGDFQIGVGIMFGAGGAGPLKSIMLGRAAGMLRSAIKKAEAGLPQRSIYLAMFHWQLGYILHLMEDRPGAEEQFGRALGLVRDTCGMGHPKALMLAIAYGAVHLAANRAAQGRELFDEAARANLERFGPDNHFRPVVLLRWAEFEADAGNDDRGAELAREATGLIRRLGPAPTSHLALSLSDAELALPAGRHARLRADLLGLACPVAAAIYGPGSSQVAALTSRYGLDLFRAGERAAGERTISEATALADRGDARASRECRALTRLNRGRLRAHRGEWAGAEADLREANDLATTAQPDVARDARFVLAGVLVEAGRPGAAALLSANSAPGATPLASSDTNWRITAACRAAGDDAGCRAALAAFVTKSAKSDDPAAVARLVWAAGVDPASKDWEPAALAAKLAKSEGHKWGPGAEALAWLRAGNAAAAAAAVGRVAPPASPTAEALAGLIAVAQGDTPAARRHLAEAERLVTTQVPARANPYPYADSDWADRLDARALLTELRTALASIR